jgi:D-glycero-D-manno-heptose 1,7-bisphosphate phosphatase
MVVTEVHVTSKSAVFFDRDGVVNRLVDRDGGSYSPRLASDFSVCDDIPVLFRDLNRIGCTIVIVTNQPDISRALMTQEELAAMTSELVRLGATAIYVCPHSDNDRCECRKPLPGMIRQALAELDINVNKAFLVGDALTDIRAAEACGMLGVLISSRKSQTVISNPSDLRLLVNQHFYELTGTRLDP